MILLLIIAHLVNTFDLPLNQECPHITVDEGVISCTPIHTCSYYLTGTSISRTGPYHKLPGYWYGIITYNCTNGCQGTLISSTVKCKGCLICYHDLINLSCSNSNVVVILLGSLLAIVLFLISILILWRLRRQIWYRISSAITSWRVKRAERRSGKRLRRFQQFQELQELRAIT